MASDEDTLKEALELFKQSDEQSSENRKNAVDDIKFSRLGEQWDENIKKQRQEDSRPCLTINRLPSFIRQVVNDARMQKPSIEVKPADATTDLETAQVIDGLIRHIQRHSNADIAYDTALDNAVTCGFGFFRISIDYTYENSFDLEARIDRIANPLSVYWDTDTVRFDAKDWNYCFISDIISQEEYKTKYKQKDAVNFSGDTRDGVSNWIASENKVRIAEYWKKEFYDRKLLMLSDGKTIFQDILDKDENIKLYLETLGINIINERLVNCSKVKRYVIDGKNILENEDWAGKTIPICPVWGEEVIVEGNRTLRSLIRDAKDPQIMFNFWRSATTELVALAPKAPWIVPKGGIRQEDRNKWENSNSKNFAYLEYDPAAGAMPTRQPFSGVPAGALQESLNASDDMKAITGIYDASLGARGNETSGKAIRERKIQSSVSNFHFVDNLNRAIQYCGECLVDIIPSVYSQRSAIRILGEDMKEKIVRIGKKDDNIIEGKEVLFDLSVGNYDVEVKSGSSYTTQREETRETLIEIMRTVPNSSQIIGDVLMENMDFVGADKVARRLKAMLPPQISAAENAGISNQAIDNNLPPQIMENLQNVNRQ